ncbi:MAG TPA: alanine racemase C-terminal domain-containing protein, partial [bacterium]|nr:alanine racemase C-terminal domain-containing protein [bacterium]
VDDVAIARALAEQARLPYLDMVKDAPEISKVAAFPREAFVKNRAVPVRDDGQTLLVAMATLPSLPLIERFEAACSRRVRVGIAQYGLWPSKETRLSYLTRYGAGAEHLLRPVLCWKTRIVQIKDIPSGSFIGYGCTYQTTRTSRIAILPIGYSDGYDRQLSNSAHVLVKGQRAPVRGRVAMNLTAIDITDIPGVELEDEVVLLGRQGEQEVSADRLAEMAGTINYEILSRLAPHIPRIVVP